MERDWALYMFSSWCLPGIGWVMSIILLIFRYDEIEGKMTPFLKSSGYNVKKGISISDGGLFFF